MQVSSAQSAYHAILKKPLQLLKVLLAGYAEETATDDEKKAVGLWHDVALAALSKEWKAGRRLMKNGEGQIFYGTTERFGGSHLAWSLVMFKYWTKETDLQQENDIDSQDTTNRAALSSINTNGAAAGSSVVKRKPIKVCVGTSQKSMLQDYRTLRAMLNQPAKTATKTNPENGETEFVHPVMDISAIAQGLKSWDQYICDKDVETIQRRKGHTGQADVDNNDNCSPLGGVVVHPDSNAGEDDDLVYMMGVTNTASV